MPTSARIILIASLLLAAAATGCGEAGTEPDGGTDAITARINGRTWRSTAQSAAGRGTTTLAIHAARATADGEEDIDIRLNDVTGAGIYLLGDARSPSANIAIYTPAEGAACRTILQNAGSVRISRITSERVEGTFGFSAGNGGDPSAWSITEGTFSARFR